MPDISMCASTECLCRATCLRNEESGTKPSETRQSWMDFDKQRDGRLRCGSYLRATDGGAS